MVRFPTRRGLNGALIALMIVACSGINSPLSFPLTEGDNENRKFVQYAVAPTTAEWGLPEVASGAKASRLNLPAREADLSPLTRSSALFKSLSSTTRAALFYQGFVTRNASHARVSDAYLAAASAHLPVVITLDALARETARTLQALSEDLDAHVAIPATRDFLVSITDTLQRMSLPVELEASRRELMTVFCTGRKLSDPSYVVPNGVLSSVTAELVRSGLSTEDIQAARIYLAGTSFRLDGDIGAQRTHFRAAWLLGNLLQDAHSPVLQRSWKSGVERASTWLGKGRGALPTQLSEFAERAGIARGDYAHASDVTHIDAWREATFASPSAVRAYSLYGRYLPADDEVFGRALAPRVPGRTHASSLDIAYTWSSGAALLDVDLLAGHDSPRYVAALEPLRARMNTIAGTHDSVYASWLSAMHAMTLRSHSAVAEPYSATLTHDARLTQSALAAWSVGRLMLDWNEPSNDAAANPTPDTSEIDAVVELHPEAIAHLAATLEQAHRAARRLAGDSPLASDAMVSANLALLRACLQSANARAQGVQPDDSVGHELSHAATRFAELDSLGEAMGVSSVIRARVEVDLGPRIASWDVGAGSAREGLFLVPDASSGKWVLRTGLVIPHEEGAAGATEHPMVGTYFVGEK